MNKNEYVILHLSLIKDVGSKTINRLLQVIDHENLSDVYNFSLEDFLRFGIDKKRSCALVQGLQDIVLLKQELDLIKKQDAFFVTVISDAYPEHLKNISVPPAVLYYQGSLQLLSHHKMLACVGARKANSYAQDCLQQIVVPLIKDDWVVVSGGALGADTYAHKAALANQGKTVVVVGSGLCHQYPPSNKILFEQVVRQGGTIVSSFPMNTRPEAHCFPIRNRIISGLSLGCLVLQAAAKSGALITTDFALEQGREVFAVPGPLYDPLSAGCHRVIKQGAKLVATSQDILDELSLPDQMSQQKINLQVEDSKKELIEETEVLILQYTLNPISIDDLSVKTKIENDVLQEKLFDLSLDGKVSQDCMGLWSRL